MKIILGGFLRFEELFVIEDERAEAFKMTDVVGHAAQGWILNLQLGDFLQSGEIGGVFHPCPNFCCVHVGI